jgi:hypothetical protein
LFAALLAVSIAWADVTPVVTVSVAKNTTNYSDAIACPGWIDKIEVTEANLMTNTLEVCTFDGTNIVDKLVYVSGWFGITNVFRPRALATDNTGGTLTYSTNSATVITTQIGLPYERIMGGGNLKLKVTGVGVAASMTNTVNARIFYEPKR